MFNKYFTLLGWQNLFLSILFIFIAFKVFKFTWVVWNIGSILNNSSYVLNFLWVQIQISLILSMLIYQLQIFHMINDGDVLWINGVYARNISLKSHRKVFSWSICSSLIQVYFLFIPKFYTIFNFFVQHVWKLPYF